MTEMSELIIMAKIATKSATARMAKIAELSKMGRLAKMVNMGTDQNSQ